MSKVVKNLGIVKAIFVSNTPPTNTDVLWRDTNLTIPIHKWYNQSTSSWEELINTVVIDNITIKRDDDGKLYVDIATIPSLTIPDGSIMMVKLEDIPSGTLLYRRSTGDGPPEIIDLTLLKNDLQLSGINTGDQDLSHLALKSYKINDKPLNGDITLTPSDIGSPSGSGTSTGTNTGDEDEISILYKLGVADVISSAILEAILEYYVLKEEGKSLIDDTEIERISKLKQEVYTIHLPSAATVANRCSGAVEGIDYPTGWIVSADTNPIDFKVIHNLNRRVASVTVTYEDGSMHRQLFDNAAYSGIFTPDLNALVIESLATITSPINIYILFA